MIRSQITKWLDTLNKQIDDTNINIEKIRQDNIKTAKVRDDVIELLKYMDTTDLPDPVYRALEVCLKWNPFANIKENFK